MQVVQSANYLRPFPLQAGFSHAAFQIMFQQQGQEAAKYMPANRFVPPMVDGSGFQNRLCRAVYGFDRPEVFIDVSCRLGIVDSVGS